MKSQAFKIFLISLAVVLRGLIMVMMVCIFDSHLNKCFLLPVLVHVLRLFKSFVQMNLSIGKLSIHKAVSIFATCDSQGL